MAQKRRQPEIIAGRVNADGSIAAGDGFSVQKTATGTYVLKFATGFRLATITATVVGGAGIVSPFSLTETGVQINVYNNAAASLDFAFAFTAVGVQQ